MAKIIKSSRSITAATNNSGTTYYRATLDECKKALDGELNIWIYTQLDKNGFDAIEEDYYQGVVIDDVMYFIDTDGNDIEINGELYDPEDVPLDFRPESFAQYTKPATNKVIIDNLVDTDFKYPNFDKEVYDMLEKYEYEFTDLADAYEALVS
jgi:hypothetical protein